MYYAELDMGKKRTRAAGVYMLKNMTTFDNNNI
jgi:hypothetical protein